MQCEHLRWRQPLHSDALTHSEPDLIYSHLELQTNSVRYIAINRCGASCIYCYECDFIAFSSAIEVPVQMLFFLGSSMFFLARSARLACLLAARSHRLLPFVCAMCFFGCILEMHVVSRSGSRWRGGRHVGWRCLFYISVFKFLCV